MMTSDWKRVMNQIAEGVQVDLGLDVDTPPVCPTCGGTGYVRYDVPYGDPRFGKMFRCPDKTCAAVARQQQTQTEQVMQVSAWEADYDKLTFDSFRKLTKRTGALDGKRGGYCAAYTFAVNGGKAFTLTAAAQMALGVDWPGDDGRKAASVVLTGDVGTGKTGLAVAAANLLRVGLKPVTFIRTLELIKHVQEGYDEREPQSARDRLTFFGRVPFLILDEFGIKAYREDRLEIIETVIRDRDRHGLPTLYTTNLSLAECYDLWQKQTADIAAKAHWVEVGGKKLRATSSEAQTAW